MSKSTLRIVHIETGKNWRGAQVQVLHTALGQKRLGHEVSLVCPPGSALGYKAREAGLEVAYLRCRIALYGFDTLKMASYMRKVKPDIVHLHSSHAHNVGGAASRLARVPAVVLSRRMDTPITLWHHKLKYQVGYDAVIAISHGVKQALVRAGVQSDRISVVRSAIEDHWWKEPGDREKTRQKLGYTNDEIVAAVIASIEPRKGQDLLIRALPQILQAAPNVRLLLVGKDDASQPERALAKELGLESHVLFAGFRSDVKDIIAASDIIVAPSYLEGLGVSIMEAMACGKPIVASNVGGIPESVVNGQTGILVEPGDAEALAQAVASLAVNESLRQEMGRRGQLRAKADFSIDSLIHDTLDVYYQLLRLPKPEREKAVPTPIV